MVQLSAEHLQLATKYHVNPINQWYVHRYHMNTSHTPLVLPSLDNVLPAIVLQNSVVRLNIGCPYTSSRSSIHHIPPSLHLNLLTAWSWEEGDDAGGVNSSAVAEWRH